MTLLFQRYCKGKIILGFFLGGLKEGNISDLSLCEDPYCDEEIAKGVISFSNVE